MDQKLIMNLVMFGVLIFIFYFMIIRPNKKKEKEINDMRDGIKAGDEIITIGGICGKVVRVKEESVIIQVGASNTKFELTRWGISKVTSSAKSDSTSKDNEVKKPSAKNIKKLGKKEDVREADTTENVEVEETVELKTEETKSE